MDKHIVQPENAAKFQDWLANRGGILVWPSVDLSDPGFSMSSPALDKDGKPYTKPHWKCSNNPRLITDPAEVEVQVPKEVRRFRVGLRMGAQGLKVKVTEGGTRRIRAACAKAGPDSWYAFDYDTQEAVIYVPAEKVPLAEWKAA